MPYKITWERAGVYRHYFGDVSVVERRASLELISGDRRFDDLRYALTNYLEGRSVTTSSPPSPTSSGTASSRRPTASSRPCPRRGPGSTASCAEAGQRKARCVAGGSGVAVMPGLLASQATTAAS